MGTAHVAEELGLCSHGHACQAGAWGRHHRVMPWLCLGIGHTLLAFSNWPPRYLSEFLFGGPVAGPVIYYLFEILFVGQFGGQFAGQLPGQLSIIFLKSCSRASSRASYLISFRILGASSRSGQLLKASRVLEFSTLVLNLA